VVSNVWPAAIVQTCIIHYADLLVMPTWSLIALRGKGFRLVRSA
jgi:putative transposase